MTELFFFNPHAIPPFISGILLLFLGVVVLIRDRFSVASLVFNVLMLCGAIWLTSYAGMYSTSSEKIALNFSLIENSAVIFIPSLLYLFTLIVLRHLSRFKIQVSLAFLVSLILLVLLWATRSFVQGIHHYSWGFFPRYGFFGFVFMILFFIQMLVSIRLYWSEYHGAPFTRRKWQLKRLFIAFGITIFGAIDYFPAFGIPIYPLGYVAVLIFIVVLTDTIWRYRLQDITPAFAASQLVTAISDMLFVIDTKGLIRIANPAACKLLRKNEKEMMWIPIWTVNESLLTKAQLEAVLKENRGQNYETWISTRDGREVLLRVMTSILTDHHGETAAVLLIAKDTSGLRQTEAALQRKNMYILILQMIAVAANKAKKIDEVIQFTLDTIGNHMKWSTGHACIRAVSEDKMISSKLWYLPESRRFSTFRRITEMSSFEKGVGIPGIVLETKASLWIHNLAEHKNFIRRSLTGDSGLKSAFAFPVLVENEVEVVLEFFSDHMITTDENLLEVMANIGAQIARVIERYRSEMKLKRAHDELEDRVKQRTQELLETNEKLKKVSEMKSTFMITASHELKTPLTAMKGYLLLILQNKVGPLTEEQREFITHAEKATERLERLVNELLHLTKMEVREFSLKADKINIAKLLEEEVMIFKAEADQKKISLDLALEKSLGDITADEDKIRQVIENLLSNSLKYTRAQGKIMIKAKRSGNELWIEIQDTGIGIKAQDQIKIFDAFYHLHKTGLRGEDSTGIGLGVTKKIIEAHGGEISVMSEEGKGASFLIKLPVK